MTDEDSRTPVERILDRSSMDPEWHRGPLSRRTRQTQRSVESYLRAGVKPRWMTRQMEIDRGMRRERRLLERAHRVLRAECGEDAELFARLWRARARAWSFDALNELIRQHNEWYPIERDLPMDPRTRDYVLIQGRSFRRELLGPRWVLEQFPAEL